MQGFSTKTILDPKYKMPDNYDDLVKVYRTLAKSADQRLVRLESYSHDAGFENIKKWAYANAMHDIKAFSGPNAERFNTAPPATKRALVAKINSIKTFLEAPTSTKKGTLDVYKKRVASLNENNGTDFTWEDVGTFFESALYEKMDSKFTSDVIVAAVAEVQAHKDEIIKALKDIKDKRQQNQIIRGTAIKVADPMVQDAIDFMMKKHPAKVRKLLS